MIIIRTLIDAFTNCLHSVTSALIVLMSMLVAACVVIGILGICGIGLSGIMGLHIFRGRNKPE